MANGHFERDTNRIERAVGRIQEARSVKSLAQCTTDGILALNEGLGTIRDMTTKTGKDISGIKSFLVRVAFWGGLSLGCVVLMLLALVVFDPQDVGAFFGGLFGTK